MRLIWMLIVYGKWFDSEHIIRVFIWCQRLTKFIEYAIYNSPNCARKQAQRESSMAQGKLVALKVEIGRGRMPEGAVRRLAVGEVVNLGIKTGTPLMIYADGMPMGHGEVVVVGDSYGVRITDIVPAEDR